MGAGKCVCAAAVAVYGQLLHNEFITPQCVSAFEHAYKEACPYSVYIYICMEVQYYS